MTTFVQIGVQDNAFDLANLLDRVAGRPIQDSELPDEEKIGLTKLVCEQQFFQLINTGVLEVLNTLSTLPEEDFEAILSLVFVLFPRLTTEEIELILQRILPILAAHPSTIPTTPLARLRLLTLLFNYFHTALPISSILPGLPPTFPTDIPPTTVSLASTVLEHLFHFTIISEQANELGNSLPTLYNIINSYKLSPLVHARLLNYISQIATISNHSKSDEYLYRFLKSVNLLVKEPANGPAAPIFDSAHTAAITAATRALSSPLATVSNLSSSYLTPQRLLELHSVQQLSSSSFTSDRLISELLQIFAKEDVDAYLSFQIKNAAWMESQKFDSTLELQKLRILSLCALASEPTNADADGKVVLSYQAISTKLSLPLEDVETSVIDAILSGRVEAKLDQINQCAHVKRVVSANADWSALQRKLSSWRTNLQKILSVLDTQNNFIYDDEMLTEEI